MALFLDSLIKSVDALGRSITVANGDLDLMYDNAQLFLGDAKYLIMQLEKMND